MSCTEKTKSFDSAFYYEVCMLKMLQKMGLISQKEFDGISKTVEEDYHPDIQIIMS
ncbi:MAG: hypothetical protein IIT39_17695 [Clostridia bacterium]|nr:hypothetical protein [Clostridia bacterium]